MRKKLWLVGILVTLLLLMALPASAITYGQPDDGEHPYVGLVGFYDDQGEWLWRCSGTLVAPKVFLTAGHCTGADGVDIPYSAQVWFDDQVVLTDDGSGYPDEGGVMGKPLPHPDYANFAGFPNTHDVGVVILEAEVTKEKYASLPDAGVLDILATQRGRQDTTFLAVGYGINEVRPDSISLRERYKATAKLVNLRSALTDGYNIQTSNNPGRWPQDPDVKSGGTCFGDSGGPIFLSGTDTVVGITSFGQNSNCKGNGDFAYRTDIPETMDFLAGFLP